MKDAIDKEPFAWLLALLALLASCLLWRSFGTAPAILSVFILFGGIAWFCERNRSRPGVYRNAALQTRCRELIDQIALALAEADQAVPGVLEASADLVAQAQAAVTLARDAIREEGNAPEAGTAKLDAAAAGVTAQHNRVVLALQFHDLLRQRLEYVRDTLALLQAPTREPGRDAIREPATGGADQELPPAGSAPKRERVTYTSDPEENVTLF